MTSKPAVNSPSPFPIIWLSVLEVRPPFAAEALIIWVPIFKFSMNKNDSLIFKEFVIFRMKCVLYGENITNLRHFFIKLN